MNVKKESSSNSKSNEYENDISGISNNKFSYENMNKKRNMLKNQILKESNESNHSQSALNINKNLSHNNYINITEDYKYEFQKNLQNEPKNLSYTNFSFLPQSEERKLNSIQIHVTRNVLDPKEKKQLSDFDLRSKKHDNYLQGKGGFNISKDQQN